MKDSLDGRGVPAEESKRASAGLLRAMTRTDRGNVVNAHFDGKWSRVG